MMEVIPMGPVKSHHIIHITGLCIFMGELPSGELNFQKLNFFYFTVIIVGFVLLISWSARVARVFFFLIINLTTKAPPFIAEQNLNFRGKLEVATLNGLFGEDVAKKF